MDWHKPQTTAVTLVQLSMMTSSNGNIFRVTGHLCGEFTGLRWIPRTKASDTELWCFLWSAPDKRLSKQSWGWWFETQLGSLWRHVNVTCSVMDAKFYSQCPKVKINNRMYRDVSSHNTSLKLSKSFQGIRHHNVNLWKFFVCSIIRYWHHAKFGTVALFAW